MLAEAIRALRGRTGLTSQAFAQLTGIPEATLAVWERGRGEPRADEADAVARAFGVRMRDLASHGGWPLENLFFRAKGSPGLTSISETGAWRAVGEFQRATRDLAELDGGPVTPLPHIDFAACDQPPWGGDEIAWKLRDALGLDRDTPIPSMRRIADELGIVVFFVTPEELDPNIDGASTLCPRPAILVNLIEGPQCWWRTRMTIAHELCHLLADQDPARPAALVSTSSPTTHYRLFEGFDAIESRANAFAACFLAPRAAVRQVVDRALPTSEAAIVAVATRFGLGRIAAINRLTDVFRLRKETRDAMLSRAGETWTAEPNPDVAEHVGIRAGAIRSRTLAALAEGRIDALRARDLLGLPLTEALPEGQGLSEEQRAPLRSADDQARRAAQRYVFEVERRPDLVVARAKRVDDGWIAEIAESPRRLHVSFELDVSPAAA